MDLQFSPEDIKFSEEIDKFCRENISPTMATKLENGEGLTKDEQEAWQRKLYDHGYAAVNWPVEYGGTGWSTTQKYLFSTVMAKHNAPNFVAFGMSMVAPVIYTYGSDEQKQRFLPDILQSNVWWCQGYSEPGSGSDLASLQTKAVREKDYYIVNGTKTWTTLAQNADWIFCLVRTSSEGKRQEGITFLLIDMKTPGIEVQPIIGFDEGHEVNTVFFEDVKVPVENRIGEENKGWTYAKVLLQHERTNIAGTAGSKRRVQKLKEAASKINMGEGQTLLDDEDISRTLAELEIALLALEVTELRVLSEVAAGGAPGMESSILKIKGTEIQQALTELAVDIAGWYGLQFEKVGGNKQLQGPVFSHAAAQNYFNSRKTTIYGGSNEIQKNIISKMVLGL